MTSLNRTPKAAALVVVLLQPAGLPAAAQTDFYNLDKERPLRVEDAYATKRWAFELQASPFTLSQDGDGVVRFAPSLELKHGLLPGLEVAVGGHLESERADGETSTGPGSLEVSALLNLWVESRTLPAVGVRATGHRPGASDRSSWIEVRLAATRGIAGPVRAHLNAAWVGGAGRVEDRWAGLALDYVLPFRHTLLLAESWVAEPRSEEGEAGRRPVHSRAGLRRQISPTIVLDAGVGRGWSGAAREAWFVTFGVTHEFAVRALMPSSGR